MCVISYAAGEFGDFPQIPVTICIMLLFGVMVLFGVKVRHIRTLYCILLYSILLYSALLYSTMQNHSKIAFLNTYCFVCLTLRHYAFSCLSSLSCLSTFITLSITSLLTSPSFHVFPSHHSSPFISYPLHFFPF
jgi:hypothetical protein